MSVYAKEVNEYLSAIKHGDKAKFKQLFELVSPLLLGVARYYLVDKSYCEDVVSEVFQKINLYIDSYDESKDGYNWICRITENVAYNFNNKFSKNPDNTDLDSVLRETALMDDAEILMDDAESRVDLFRAIDKLDPESRELINQHFFLGKSFKEIGGEIHLSKMGVKKKIDKILSKLKIFIEN